MRGEREPRSECDWWLIFFDKLGFWIDTKVFKKIDDSEMLAFRCGQCNKIKDCTQKDLFMNLLDGKEESK